MLAKRRRRPSLLFASLQLVACGGIGGWDVDADRFQKTTSGVADLMLIAAFDEDHRSGAERHLPGH